MGVTKWERSWAGERRQIGRRGGIEEVFFTEDPRLPLKVFSCRQSLAAGRRDGSQNICSGLGTNFLKRISRLEG